MKKTFLALVLAAGLTSIVENAKADDFLFSLNNPNYGTSFSGRIFGLLNNATSAATSVQLFEVNGIQYNLPIDNVGQSSFTVLNGALTAASFNGAASNPPQDLNVFLLLNTVQDAGYYWNEASVNGDRFTPFSNLAANYQLGGNFSGVTYTAVPEPSTYALFGLGALALVVAYRRKVA